MTLFALLVAWVEALVSESDDPEKQRELLEMDTDAPTKLAHKLGGEPKFKVSGVQVSALFDSYVQPHGVV